VAKKLSATALLKQSPLEPIERWIPISRQRSPKRSETYWRPTEDRSALELCQPPLEEAPLGIRVDELERAVVGRAGVLDAIEPAQ
jgi:hypothetical protein